MAEFKITPVLNLKKLIAESREMAKTWNKFTDDLERIEKKYEYKSESEVSDLPPVTPQPKTGHWILDDSDNSITCDKCGCQIWANDISNGDAHFCPNCGAIMKKRKE